MCDMRTMVVEGCSTCNTWDTFVPPSATPSAPPPAPAHCHLTPDLGSVSHRTGSVGSVEASGQSGRRVSRGFVSVGASCQSGLRVSRTVVGTATTFASEQLENVSNSTTKNFPEHKFHCDAYEKSRIVLRKISPNISSLNAFCIGKSRIVLRKISSNISSLNAFCIGKSRIVLRKISSNISSIRQHTSSRYVDWPL